MPLVVVILPKLEK
nr:unnamed protein product [Callosobruchus analis]